MHVHYGRPSPPAVEGGRGNLGRRIGHGRVLRLRGARTDDRRRDDYLVHGASVCRAGTDAKWLASGCVELGAPRKFSAMTVVFLFEVRQSASLCGQVRYLSAKPRCWGTPAPTSLRRVAIGQCGLYRPPDEILGAAGIAPKAHTGCWRAEA